MSFLSSFSIQAGKPDLTRDFDEFDSLSEAISRIVKFPSENLIIFWRDCYIPICYKYEMQLWIHDLLLLVDKMLNSSEGREQVSTGCDTLHSTWKCEWSEDRLDLNVDWIKVRGHCLERLQAQEGLRLSKSQFLCEWKRPLSIILFGLREVGHTKETIPELEALEQAVSMIPKEGAHYSASALK